MKTCPFCAEQVQDAARYCPHCTRDIRRDAVFDEARKEVHKGALRFVGLVGFAVILYFLAMILLGRYR